MAKLSTDELLDAFKEMTLLELSEFVKQFEETFGVTAAAPVAVAAAPAAGGAAGDAGEAAAEQDEFDVILEAAGDKKINVIKEVRALMGVGIEINNLTKSFGKQLIWGDVTLTVPAGEICVMLGPSGTGKSVLLKTIIGLLKPDTGSVVIEGVDIASCSEKELYEIRK